MQYLLSAVPILLMSTGIFYFIRLRGFYLRHPIRTLSVLGKKPTGQGISPTRALLMALAGTLGVGNIVGVATALSLGGAGAVFWMLLSATIAMVLKYAEIVLALKHRRWSQAGEPCGGAPYYIQDEFARRGWRTGGKILATIFALLCLVNTFTMGSMLQSNAVAMAIQGVFDIPVGVVGGVLSLLCIPVVWGGVKKISAVTQTIVPLMTLGFLVMCLAVIVLRWERVPTALASIVTQALDTHSVGGGIAGFLTSQALRYGVMRGLVSNEAGCGTAPMVHATAQTNCPAEQGVFGLVEVFVDTILLCSITALAILVSDSGYTSYPHDGVKTAVSAFTSVLGDWAGGFFAIAVLFFGVATIFCWAHYGMTALTYLYQPKAGRKGVWGRIFLILYVVSVWVGAVTTPDGVWAMADVALAVMTVINLAVLWLMNGEVREETKEWMRRR